MGLSSGPLRRADSSALSSSSALFVRPPVSRFSPSGGKGRPAAPFLFSFLVVRPFLPEEELFFWGRLRGDFARLPLSFERMSGAVGRRDRFSKASGFMRKPAFESLSPRTASPWAPRTGSKGPRFLPRFHDDTGTLRRKKIGRAPGARHRPRRPLAGTGPSCAPRFRQDGKRRKGRRGDCFGLRRIGRGRGTP